jgi:hypothetical protein
VPVIASITFIWISGSRVAANPVSTSTHSKRVLVVARGHGHHCPRLIAPCCLLLAGHHEHDQAVEEMALANTITLLRCFDAPVPVGTPTL